MRPSAADSRTANRADGTSGPVGRMAKVRGWRRCSPHSMALRSTTLRISGASTAGWSRMRAWKSAWLNRHTSLSRKAATLRMRLPWLSTDISPTRLPGVTSAISTGSRAGSAAAWRNTPRQPLASTYTASASSPGWNSGAPPGSTSRVSLLSMAWRLRPSRSQNKGVLCNTRRSL